MSKKAASISEQAYSATLDLSENSTDAVSTSMGADHKAAAEGRAEIGEVVSSGTSAMKAAPIRKPLRPHNVQADIDCI